MGKDRTKEEQESDIYTPYLEYHNASSPESKDICFLKFWDAICQWDWYIKLSKKYLKTEICPCGLEIEDALKRVLEKRKKERDKFFSYLYSSLKNAMLKYIEKGEFEKKPKDIYKPQKIYDDAR